MKNIILLFLSLSSLNVSARSTDPSLNLRTKLQKQLSENHKPLSYKDARRKLFGVIHLEGDKESNYLIKDIYCLKSFTKFDFPKHRSIGPNMIPDHTVLNTEHVWPKSRFSESSKYKTLTEFKVSDLHILYPSSSQLNSARSNFKYGEVEKLTRTLACPGAKIGKTKNGKIFEPPMESKGNVARASFYFSVRYNRPIDPLEEETLRKWHKNDPVDAMEKRRNDLIQKYQGNRNPFIDSPALVDKLKDF